MVRLADLPDYERAHLLAKNDAPVGPPAFTLPTRPLNQQRLALVTTAGLHIRGSDPFGLTDASFRPIPGEAVAKDLVMSHTSVNFDRTGFQEDINVVFPIDRVRELASRVVVGSLADVHYSFMGAGLPPAAYRDSAQELAALLHRDAVDTVFLTPI